MKMVMLICLGKIVMQEAVNLSLINIQTYPYVQERLYSNENSSSEGWLL
jgi:hypothetical protein